MSIDDLGKGISGESGYKTPAEQAYLTITRHCDEAGLDDEGDIEIGLYHLIRDVLDLCEEKEIDLNAILAEARRDHIDHLNDA